jgi:shikimate dehydrogenase
VTVHIPPGAPAVPAGCRVFLLIGQHLGHSLSAAIWNSVWAAAGQPLRYVNAEVEGAGLADRLASLRRPEFAGANVTAPYKRAAAAAVDAADPVVRRSGACNFVVNRAGVLHGFNTDVTAVERAFAGRAFGTAVVLGAGGAGAAAVTGMRSATGRVLVLDRDPRAAAGLAERATAYGPPVSALDWPRRADAIRGADVVVNATPLGSDPADVSPIAAQWLAHRPAIYDFVYAGDPVVSRLAAATGCPLHDGLAHLADQAVGMLGELGSGPGLAAAIGAATARAAGRAPRRWDHGPRAEPA